jgi:hypothetical protein
MTKYWVVFALTITMVCFGVIWAEDAWSDFYHWGPPFQVGSITVKDWTSWAIFVGLLVLYQASHVYLEETAGREFERKHTLKIEWTKEDVFIMSCYNFYKWLGTILHILVAVTRVDVWLLIAFVDTLARFILWNCTITNGRKPRIFNPPHF